METSIVFYHPYIAAHIVTDYLSNEQDQVYADAVRSTVSFHGTDKSVILKPVVTVGVLPWMVLDS